MTTDDDGGYTRPFESTRDEPQPEPAEAFFQPPGYADARTLRHPPLADAYAQLHGGQTLLDELNAAAPKH